MAVKVYHSTDASAPALDASTGSLINLLKKCLIDGYGAKTPLGWEGLFTADYKYGAFRSAQSDSSRLWLHVNDNVGQYANVKGYEGLDSLDAAGAPVNPVNAWAGYYWCKSGAAVGTNKQWSLVGDEYLFWLNIQAGIYSSESLMGRTVVGFGDFLSFIADDPYRCLLVANKANNQFNQWTNYFDTFGKVSNKIRFAQSCHYLPRRWTGIPGGVAFGKLGHPSVQAINSDECDLNPAADQGVPFPNYADNGMYIAPMSMVESDGVLRGRLPGCYVVPHNRPLSHLQTISAADALPGRTLLAWDVGTASYAPPISQVYLDITGPWR